MAKYTTIYDENDNIFKDVIAIADLERLVNVKILANNTQKEIGKVIKTNDLVRFMTKQDVVIIINETIYDQLEEKQKRLVADELVTWISYDTERDRVVITKPDITTFSGILRKYTFEVYERLYETIKSLYDKKKNDDAENGEEKN
jgi:hypothetical protein